jgi:DNA-binding NarL/FixJ family response regulator
LPVLRQGYLVMLKSRYAVRKLLKDCPRKVYQNLIYVAKLTPAQENIINLYILQGLSICDIADRVNLSESSVRRIIAKVYDYVYPFARVPCGVINFVSKH